MNDQTLDRLVAIGGILLALWLAVGYGRRNPAVVQPVAAPSGTTDPNLVNYAQNFGGGLPFVQPTPINVNIGNQAVNWLNSNYMPLFGFVGMAQGTTYQ